MVDMKLPPSYVKLVFRIPHDLASVFFKKWFTTKVIYIEGIRYSRTQIRKIGTNKQEVIFKNRSSEFDS